MGFMEPVKDGGQEDLMGWGEMSGQRHRLRGFDMPPRCVLNSQFRKVFLSQKPKGAKESFLQAKQERSWAQIRLS